MEEAGREFFLKVEQGFFAITEAEPNRIKRIDATQSVEDVNQQVWQHVAGLIR
jgi:thymidylate kinase